MHKILNIGLPRTGTQSLTIALRELGYRSVHYPESYEVIEAHDACTEVRFGIRELVTRFPASRYILTVRDSRSWLDSVERTFPRAAPGWNPFWFLPADDRLRLHLDRIVEAVAAVPQENLLLMNICNGDGWEKLCRFLDVTGPAGPFPNRDDFKN